MPRRRTVCDHPERHSIVEALVTGAPYRSVAKHFGLLESTVHRHKTEHLPVYLLNASDVEEENNKLDSIGISMTAGSARTGEAAGVGAPAHLQHTAQAQVI